MKRYMVCVSALVFVGGCYSSSFVRNDGPVRGGGIAITLVGQRCDFSPDFSEPQEIGGSVSNRLDLGIRVAVENDSQETITVAPENLRLVVAGVSDPPMTAPQPLQVAPGATAKVDVRFQHRGDLGCNANLSLGLEKVVLSGARPVELRPVSFVANNDET
jgi:hypothetical protein